MEKLSKLLRDLLSSHPIKCSYILYIYLGESLSLKKLHCTHKLMINYCTKFWQSKKVMCNFPMNSGGTGLDTSGAITQFGTTFESSSGLEVREIWSTISYHIALRLEKKCRIGKVVVFAWRNIISFEIFRIERLSKETFKVIFFFSLAGFRAVFNVRISNNLISGERTMTVTLRKCDFSAAAHFFTCHKK